MLPGHSSDGCLQIIRYGLDNPHSTVSSLKVKLLLAYPFSWGLQAWEEGIMGVFNSTAMPGQHHHNLHQGQ